MNGAVIFDLDGTLTRPFLDFDAIRAELGLPPGPILEAMSRMTAPDRQRAEVVVHEHERRAAEQAELQPGACETIDHLRSRGFPVAILTRNSRISTGTVLNRFAIRVDAIRTRDDGVVKPSPEPVLALCRTLGVDPRASWMVGDYLFDIQAGRAAGATTILLQVDDAPPSFAGEADHVIQSLPEVLAVVDDAG